MIIYHASDVVVLKPDVLHSRNNLDFGRGFYATTIERQAELYAQRFLDRRNKGIINTYEYSPTESLKIKLFDAYDEEWLDFVAECRKGKDIFRSYDVISGGIADDRVFNTLDLYFSNMISKDECLRRLIYEKPNHQLCFTNQRTIDNCIKFIKSEEL